MSSSRDFGVEQFFRADEFRADDPSPFRSKKVIIVFELFQLLQRNARIQRVFDALRIFGVNLHEGGRHCAAASNDDESEDGGHGRVVVTGSRFGGIVSFGGEYLLNIFLKPLVKRQM